MKKWKSIAAGTWKPDKKGLSEDEMYQIVGHLCRFLLREVISPTGRFHEPKSDLGENHRALCLWGGSRQSYEPQPLRTQNMTRMMYHSSNVVILIF